eukprot:91519_1
MSNKTTSIEGEKNGPIEPIKILFLDIDGVMNGWHDVRDDTQNVLKPACLERLQQIIDHTHCKIVLSTARRACEEIKHSIEREFIKAGIQWNDVYIGDTPLLHAGTSQEQQRLIEIATYLERIKRDQKFRVEGWVVVDDLSLDNADHDKQMLKGRFVQTDGRIGISDIDVTQIINILKYYDTQCVIL